MDIYRVEKKQVRLRTTIFFIILLHIFPLPSISADKVITIYFVKGHGENDISSIQKLGYKAARDAIEKENYLIKELLLMNSEEKVPSDASVIVISGPKKDFQQDEIKKLKNYLENGGSLLVMVDPGYPLTVKNFLEGYGFKVGDDVIFDIQSRTSGANELTPVVYQYNKDHPLTSEFNLATYFYLAGTIDIEKDMEKGKYQLAMTGPNSWAEKDLEKWSKTGDAAFDEGKEKRGPLSIAAVTTIPVKRSSGDIVEDSKKMKEGRFQFGKIIAFGDSDFANNTNINLAGNGKLFLNTIIWLADGTKKATKNDLKLFGMPLKNAMRDKFRDAIKKAGGKAKREDIKYWCDTYNSSSLLEGSSELVTCYSYANNTLATAQYEFRGIMDTKLVVRVRNMVSQKYGEPDNSNGNPELGNVEHKWVREDIVIRVFRGWPDTTTYLKFELPEIKKIMEDEMAAEEKAIEQEKAKKQSDNF